MIPEPALRSWLADRGAQARSANRMDALARRWSETPSVRQLERDLAALATRSPEAILAAARDFLDEAGELDAFFGELMAASRDDPFFRPHLPPFGGEIQTGLLLYHQPELSIAAGLLGADLLAAKKLARRGPASITFSGVVTLMRFVKAGQAVFSFWEIPPIGEDFDASRAGRCRLVDRRRIEDGEEIVVDGRHQSFVIEHARSDILFFQAAARVGAAPVAAEYDIESGELVGASSTDEASSRLQLMVSLLRAMDCDQAFPLFEQALASPLFYVRWHIMREMLALDADAAVAALRRIAAQDPHPEVRATAVETLRRFFEPAELDPGGVSCPA